MTLTQYGPTYTAFTIEELRNFLRKRNIETPYRDRKRVMRVLRQADLKATFRFLDLPAELRNLVYVHLLTIHHPSKYHSLSKQCYPAILASCNQIHSEANGYLNKIGEVQIGLHVRERDFRIPTGQRPTHYGLDVVVEGAVIYSAKRLERLGIIQWPALIRRARKIILKASVSPIPHINFVFASHSNDEVQFNNAVHQLLTFLSGGHEATSLESEMSANLSMVPGFELSLRKILSPLPALAGSFPNSTFRFSQILPSLAAEMSDATSAYRMLHCLKEDVSLANDINMRIYRYAAVEFERFSDFLVPKRSDEVYIYEDNHAIRNALPDIEKAIESAANEELDNLPGTVVELVRQLRALRARRGEHAQL